MDSRDRETMLRLADQLEADSQRLTSHAAERASQCPVQGLMVQGIAEGLREAASAIRKTLNAMADESAWGDWGEL